MENRTLFNWYNEKFAVKIPASVTNYHDYKRQAKQTLERRLERLRIQNKVQKDLYLRAKTKLNYDQKRQLISLKTHYKSKTRVLKESIKQLRYAQDLAPLIKYEIKKNYAQKKNLQRQVRNYYQWLTKTIDETDFKITNFKTTLEDYQTQEKKAITKQIYLEIMAQLIKLKVFDYQTLDLTTTRIQTNFNHFQRGFINSAAFDQLVLVKLASKLQQIVTKSHHKLTELTKKIKEQKQENEQLYHVEKKNLQLRFKQRILNAEYSYNQEHEKQRVIAKNHYATQLVTIKSNYSQQQQRTKGHDAKVDQYVASLQSASKNARQKARQSARPQKVAFKINYKLQNLQRVDALVKRLNLASLKTIQKQVALVLATNMPSQKMRAEVSLLKKQFSEQYRQVIQQFKNEATPLQWRKGRYILKNVLQFIYRYDARKIAFAQFQAELLVTIGTLQQNYSYDGNFVLQKAQALKKWKDDWGQIYEAMILEKIEVKIKLIDLKNKSRPLKQKEARIYQTKRRVLKAETQQKRDHYQMLYRQKTIQKLALKAKKQQLAILQKEELRSLLLTSEIKKARNAAQTFLLRYQAKRKVYKKVYDSKVAELVKEIPCESFHNLRYLGAVLNLFVPGLAELFLFKQKIKGLIMLAVTTFFYSFVVPFSFGYIWTKMGGILGLVDMGASKHSWAKGIVPDARYYLLGGVISIILLTALIVYLLTSAIAAYKVGKSVEEGSRPSTWTHTKRWLNTEGFPWMISMPGWFLIIFIIITPIVTSLLISFTNMGFNHEPPGRKVLWVGLSQYGKWWTFRHVGMAKSIFRVLSWTIIWTITSSALVIFLGTVFAVLVNKHQVKLKKMWRMIYIIPWAIPAFVTIMFLKSAFQPDQESLMNLVLLKMHLIRQPINWFGSIWTVRIILIVIQGWLGHAYIFLLITGNMQSIPKNIYEAGSIDGAKGNQMFWRLTAPALLASIAPLLIAQFTFAFNNFTIISLFSGGGPAYTNPTPFLEGGTDILISWIYKLTTGIAQIDGNIAFSAAMTTIAAMISVSIAAYGFSKSTAMRGE